MLLFYCVHNDEVCRLRVYCFTIRAEVGFSDSALRSYDETGRDGGETD